MIRPPPRPPLFPSTPLSRSQVPRRGRPADQRRNGSRVTADDDVLRRRPLQPARVDEHVEEIPREGERRGQDIHRARKDRKSTRLNSSHQIISYAVFCLKKKK